MTFADAYKVLAKEWVKDPLKFAKFMWPDVEFYNKQREVIYSIRESVETYVVAGHELGKDFVSGFIALSHFLCPQMYYSQEHIALQKEHYVRVVTTSVRDDHLRILWAEINRFIRAARLPLDSRQGGPLVVNHHELRLIKNGKIDPMSYMIGMVAEKPEGFTGHHAPYALLVVDEASGMDDEVKERCETWTKRELIIGNPYESQQNFFERGVKGGNVLAASHQGNGQR